MKKFLVVILAIIAAFSLVACGTPENNQGEDKVPETNVQQPTDNGGDNGETGDTTGNDNDVTDDTGNAGSGENGGDNEPSYIVVQPITDGGSFVGGNYE